MAPFLTGLRSTAVRQNPRAEARRGFTNRTGFTWFIEIGPGQERALFNLAGLFLFLNRNCTGLLVKSFQRLSDEAPRFAGLRFTRNDKKPRLLRSYVSGG